VAAPPSAKETPEIKNASEVAVSIEFPTSNISL